MPQLDKKDLTVYLTSEIQTLTNSAMSFRTKVSFTLWVGPFLVLGSLILATKGEGRLEWTTLNVLAMLAAGLAFIGLGFFAGILEGLCWKRINIYRDCIANLCADETDIASAIRLPACRNCNSRNKSSLFDPHYDRKRVAWFYALAFAMMLTAFSGTAKLASSVVWRASNTPSGLEASDAIVQPSGDKAK